MLENDDVLKVISENEQKTMYRMSEGKKHWYYTDFPFDETGTQFILKFERSVDSGAPESVVWLPAKYEIIQPKRDETYSIQDELVISWDRSDSHEIVKYKISGDQLESTISNEIEGDPGTIIIPASDLRIEKEFNTVSCRLTISCGKRGTVDPSFGEGGFFLGWQSRAVNFKLTRDSINRKIMVFLPTPPFYPPSFIVIKR